MSSGRVPNPRRHHPTPLVEAVYYDFYLDRISGRSVSPASNNSVARRRLWRRLARATGFDGSNFGVNRQ